MCGRANEGAKTSERARAGHPSLLGKITVMEIVELIYALPKGRISGRRREKIANISTEANSQQIIFGKILLNLPVH